MKKTEAMKKLLGILLSLCMLLQYVPVTALAAAEDGLCDHHSAHTDACGYVEGVSGCTYHCDECLGDSQNEAEADGTAAVPVVSESVVVTETVSPEVDLPANDELFAMYAEQKLYGSEWATYGTAARENLNAVEQAIYDILKTEIEAVAANGGSTYFTLTEVSGLKTEWTSEELGVESIEDTTEAQTQFVAQFDMGKIVSALLSDCPFDLYWYDKTEGAAMSYSYSRSGKNVSGTTYWTTISFTELHFAFEVASGYQGGDHLTVTSDVSKVTTAKTNAQAIVSTYASGTDYEKLVAYKEQICDLVSYNDEAAEDSYTGGYGDPWQLIYVFDGDTTTEVVCEGYAKAFQYLCDLGGLDCISVTGMMGGGTGAGGHMWNIVELDGANYLVDVTNCDTGTIGAPDALFLVGNATGSVAEGYTFTISGQNISFTYDDDILSTWTESQLTLAAADYEPPAPCTHAENTNTDDGDCISAVVCSVCGGTITEAREAHDYVDGICSVCGSYEPCEGEGTAQSPYLIANVGNLYWFAAQVNGGAYSVSAKLTADIVVNENVLGTGGTLNGTPDRVWTPINRFFYGTFDGGEHTISGLYFNNSSTSYAGLFAGLASGGAVQNVGVIDSYISGNDYVGGVVGHNDDGSVTNCYNAGSVTGSDNVGGVVGESYSGSVADCYNTGIVSGERYVGGVVGHSENNSVADSYNKGLVSGSQRVGGVVGYNEVSTSGAASTVNNCVNYADVIGSTQYVGGVVGYNKGSVYNSCNHGTISGNGSYVSGVAGYNNGTVMSSCNAGAVSGADYVGGIAGESYGDNNMNYCYNTGAISGSDYVGGLTGWNHSNKLQYSYTAGTVSGTGNNVGAVTGWNDSYSTAANCYYDSTVCTVAAIGTDDREIDTNVVAVTTEKFASGEVCYLLNGTQSQIFFKQTLGEDDYPNFTGGQVYKNQTGGCGESVTYAYSNTQADAVTTHTPGAAATCTTPQTCTTCGAELEEALSHSFVNGICSVCGAACEHTFENGICSVCGTGIAYNPSTGTNYGTLAEALAAAQSGETVALQGDCEESRILVYPGVTLDLNGHTLTAEYVVGFNTSKVFDSSNNAENGYAAQGLLVVDPDNLVLYENNGAVPVYNPEKGGFIFVDFLFQSMAASADGITTVNMLVTSKTMEVIELLKDGAADNDIQVIVRLTWDNETGTAYQDFVFNETTIQDVMQSNEGSYGSYGCMFYVNIIGLDALENVEATVMIVSGSNAVDQGSTLSVN